MWISGVQMSEDIQLKQPADLEHTDKDLVDKNILGAMVLDTIKESYPGIKQFFSTLKLLSLIHI